MSGAGDADARKSELLNRFNTAVQLHTQGQVLQAAQIYDGLLADIPNHPDVLDLFGTALMQLGRPEAGRDPVVKSLRVRPLSASTWNHLGAIDRVLKNDRLAQLAFCRSSIIDPGGAEPYVNRAAMLGDAGRADRGLLANGRAMVLSPESKDVELRQGVLLSQAECFDDSLPWLRRAWRDRPGNPELALHLNRVLVAGAKREEGRRIAMAGLVVSPSAFELVNSLVSSHDPAHVAQRDIDWTRFGTVLLPLGGASWSNLSAETYRDGRFEAARLAARRSVLLAPGEHAGLRNLSSATIHLHDFDLCRKATAWSLAVRPEDPDALFLLAEIEFRDGDLKTGWQWHEARFRRQQFRPRLNVPPPWQGPGTEEGPLLIASEQGIGDEVIFLSCLAEMRDRIEVPIVIEVDRRLVDLMKRSFPGGHVVPRQVVEGDVHGQFFDYASLVHDHDIRHVVYQGSLPRFLDRNRDQPLHRTGYLKGDPQRIVAWRDWLASIDERPKVGVIWRTVQWTRFRAKVHCTIDDLMPVFDVPGVTFVNLMFGSVEKELDRVRAVTGAELHVPPELDIWNDIDGLVALMAALDVVVSARTANYAFAAAVGVPTIRLAQSFMHISQDRDFFFPNAFAVLEPKALFDGEKIGQRAAIRLRELTTGR